MFLVWPKVIIFYFYLRQQIFSTKHGNNPGKSFLEQDS